MVRPTPTRVPVSQPPMCLGFIISSKASSSDLTNKVSKCGSTCASEIKIYGNTRYDLKGDVSRDRPGEQVNPFRSFFLQQGTDRQQPGQAKAARPARRARPGGSCSSRRPGQTSTVNQRTGGSQQYASGSQTVVKHGGGFV